MTPDPSSYTIGWITALPIELAAATIMLDKEYDAPYMDGQDITPYTFGRMGRDNVVIACLPGGQTGLSAATAAAIHMRNMFKSIEHRFMVGIGGGVPSEKDDIRLGDVVISLPTEGHGGVVQYDFGKAEADGRFRPTGHLNTPPKLLLNVVNQARRNLFLGRSQHALHLAKFGQVFSRSSAGPDILFQATYNHAGGSTCKGCKSDMLVERQTRKCQEPSDGASSVKIHFGTIASGNKVIKDARTRDEISEQLGGHILCFETEAAGLMNDFPCLVVRGICDYADSHKQDNWQGYAAATAAAYTKELMSLIPSAHVSSLMPFRSSDHVPSTGISKEVHFRVPFNRNPDFIGRGGILLELDNLISPLNRRTRLAIWGLGGCGKSAVALEFAYRVHTREPDRAIFWIRASSRDHYKTAFRDIAIFYDIPGAHDLEHDIMSAVKTKLMDSDIQKWLIVVDNADDPEILLSEDGPNGQRLKDYLPSRAGCKTLFTARDKHTAIQLIGVFDPMLEIESLGLAEAQQLFEAIVPHARFTNDDCVKELLIELTCLPLAVVQAAAFIRENDINVETYLHLFREQDAEDESTDILGQEFEDETRYPKVGNALTTSWHISFKQLARRSHLAFDCLRYLACLSYSDIPETLVTSHIQLSHLDRVRVIGTLVGYQFLVRQHQGDLFDTHRLVHLATRRLLRLNHDWKPCVQRAITTISERIPYGGYREHNQYSGYLPHAICLLGHIDHVNIVESEATSDLMSKIAACQRDLGDYSAAERSHRAVLRWRLTYLQEYHRKTLQAMQDVGQDLMMRGQYSEAEAKHRKTFTLRFRYLGPADVETLGSMRNVADALGFQSKWEEYETLSKELTKLSAACYGSTHMITLSGLKALSVCQCQHGRFIYAEKLAREVVDGRKKAKGLGEMHPSTLKSISHLAIILGHNNKWSEAEALELHTSKSLELILGPMHPDTLTSKCNLARIWIHLEKLSAAKTMFYEILEARLKLLGSEHPDTRKSISYVSRFCKDQQLPESTRRFSEESPNPKHLVWTEHNSEGDMCAPPELDARFPEASEVVESLHQQGLTTKTEKYDDQAVQWELSWTEIDRLDLVWRCKSKSDITWKIIASVLPKLAPIDPKETWTWLKNNIPGLQSYPIRVPTSSLPVVEPSVELSDELFATSSLWAYGRTVSSNSRSSDGPSSIYRTALSSQRSQNCSGGQQNVPLADVMDLDMAKGPSIIRSFSGWNGGSYFGVE